MEREAMMSRRVDELKCELECTCHESQDWAAEVTRAWATELLAVERATATKRGLDAMKIRLAEVEAAEVRLAETEAAL